MNKIFVMPVREEINEKMTICDTGLESVNGAEEAAISERLEAKHFVNSFLQKEGIYFTQVTIENILNDFLLFLKNMTIEDIKMEDSQEIIKEKIEEIKDRWEILDL